MRLPFRLLSLDLTASPRLSDWLQGLALWGACLLVFGGALSGGFIWDDDHHLTQNPCIIGPESFADIWSSAHARIGPLTISSFYLQHALWGEDPMPYHLVTLLLHALSGCLLWLVLRRLHVAGAWWGALLWSIHPVQVESVAWITELKNTQSGAFYLLSAWLFLKHLQDEDRRRLHYALAVLAGFLAMASKSSTVVLPVMLALCAWWEKTPLDRRLLLKLVPFVLLSLASAAVSIWTQGIEGGLSSPVERTPLERVAVSGMVFWFYLRNLLWPANLMFIYPRWTPDLQALTTWLPVLTMMAVLGTVFVLRQGKARALALVVSAYFVPLLPVLGLIEHFFLRYSAVGDHFQYLASMAPLAGLAALISLVTGRYGGRGAAVLLLSLIAIALGGHSRQRVPIFHSDIALWEDSYRRNPISGMVLTNLAVLRLQQGKMDEVENLLERAMVDTPRDATTLYNLGLFRARTGRFQEAIPLLQAADQEQPNNSGILSNLGAAQRGAGDDEAAVATLREAWRLDTENIVALYNLCELQSERLQFDEIIPILEEWLERHPEDQRARRLLIYALRHRR